MQLAYSAENIAKVALYVTLLIMPGGSVIALALWWANRRWGKGGALSSPFALAPASRPVAVSCLRGSGPLVARDS